MFIVIYLSYLLSFSNIIIKVNISKTTLIGGIINQTHPHHTSTNSVTYKRKTRVNSTSFNNKNTINVKTYGATGNGITDDYPAIINAINSGYKNIYLPKGIYRVTQEINLLSNIRLYGDGQETILKFSRPNNCQSGYILKGVDIKNTIIENLKVDCSFTSTVIAAIRFEGAKNIHITNVWLNKPYNGGINFGGPQFFGGKKVSENCIAKRCKVTNVQYYNQSTGYACFTASGGSKNCVFEDCDVKSNICDAYSSDYAFNIKFIRCSFFGGAGAGFTAEGEQTGNARTVFYESCIADLNGRSGTGFFISENTNAILNNCTIKNISGKGVVGGIWLQNVNTTINNCKLFNIKTQNGGYGGGAIFSQPTNAGKPTVVNVRDCEFYNNTFDISNYNLGRELVTLQFTNCVFNDPVNSYFVSGKFYSTYQNCTFKNIVTHSLQGTSSKAYYTNCKFFKELQQGINGIDTISIKNSDFYDGTQTRTAIVIADGSPRNSVKISNCNFYGFGYVINRVNALDPLFLDCKFEKCIHSPKVLTIKKSS